MTQYLTPQFSFTHCIHMGILHPIIKHIGTEGQCCILSFTTVWNKEGGRKCFLVLSEEHRDGGTFLLFPPVELYKLLTVMIV